TRGRFACRSIGTGANAKASSSHPIAITSSTSRHRSSLLGRGPSGELCRVSRLERGWNREQRRAPRPGAGDGSSPLFSRIVPRAELDDALRREMVALMRVCYEGVSPERFAADLASKQFVILLFAKGTRRLVGFSTLRITEEQLNGRTVDLAYSG